MSDLWLRRASSVFAAIGLAAASFVLAPSVSDAAPGPPLSDLRLVSGGAATVPHGRAFPYTVTLVNAGAGPTTAGQRVTFDGSMREQFAIAYIKVNNPAFSCAFENSAQIAIEPPHPLWACVSTAPLAPGASVTATFKVLAKATASPGAYLFDAFADSPNWIVESDEANNSSRKSVNVT